MTEASEQGAWGYGLATLSESGDRVLDTWFPEPQLGLDDAPAGAGHAPARARTRARPTSRPRPAATSAAACAPSSC